MKYAVPLKSLPPLVREFASYKAVMQNASEKTISEYLLDLRTFFRFLLARDADIDMSSEEFEKIDISGVDLDYIKNITTEDIYEFLLYADGVRGNMAAAKSRKLSSIKGFFKYLHIKRMMLDDNPAINIETPKRKQALPKFLSMEESLMLLEAVKNDKESKSRVRDYAIITLFLNCGMRVSELVGIDLNDVDRDLRSLTVTGKGNKQRIVYLNSACKQALADYYAERLGEKHASIDSKALFLSNREQRISVKTVQWLVYKYLELAGLESKHYSVHKLRHTAATLMYQTGEVDVRVLKDILGHEQLNTTQIYTHVSNRSMEEAMEHNPLATQKSLPKDNFTPLDKKEDEDDSETTEN
ncbi:MAG: tyrosine-type recombinase/integrase [Clostridia bacterium]|nr:tyrosine-type recombinase/integrase [Clostridia bacterium]